MYPAPPVTRTVLLVWSACLPAVASAEAGRRTPRGSVSANGVVGEAVLLHLVGRKEVPTIEHNRAFHQRLHAIEVRPSELAPLGHDRQTVGALQRLVVGREILDMAVEDATRYLCGFRVVRLNLGAG